MENKRMKNSAIITENAVAVFTQNGKCLSASSSHPNFRKILDRIKREKFGGIEKLFDLGHEIKKDFGFEIRGGQVYWNGEVVNTTLTRTILDFKAKGYPIKNLVNFFVLLQENPSKEARESLYDYLSKNLLPIDSEGYFYGVKAIRSDWMDKFSGKVSNRVGNYVSMPREAVSKDPNQCAGAGLHCGNSHYVKGYGGANDRFILVKVHPKDVVIVPREGDKIRLCAYTVVREITRDTLEFVSNVASKNPQIRPVLRKKCGHDGYKKQIRINGRFGPKCVK